MKTKILLIVLTAVTLLSFTIVTANKSTSKTETNSEQANKGFALQDSNQF